MLISEVYLEYCEYIENRLKIQTKKSICERFERIILPILGDYDIYKFNERDYIKFQNEIEKRNYSDNYKKSIHCILSGFFNYCVCFLELEKNVIKNVGPFRKNVSKKERDFYTYKEFKKFIKSVDDIVDNTFFTFLFFTGTRPGEAMALKFSDFYGSYISINKTISEHCVNGQRIVNSPKTKQSNRKVKIDFFLKLRLNKLKKYYMQKYNIDDFDFYIFGGIKPLAPTTINRHKENACKKAHIRPIDLHEFRHSHATLLFDKKISVKAIQGRLGHSSSSITLNTYIHGNNIKQEKKVLLALNSLRFKI